MFHAPLRRQDNNLKKELDQYGAEFDPEQAQNTMNTIDKTVARKKILFGVAAGLTLLASGLTFLLGYKEGNVGIMIDTLIPLAVGVIATYRLDWAIRMDKENKKAQEYFNQKQ